MLSLSVFTFQYNVGRVYAWSGDIVIHLDGSVTPSGAPVSRDGDLYRLTADLVGSVSVWRGNTVLDGGGHSIQAVGDFGIRIYPGESGRLGNVTVRNVMIEGDGESLFGIQVSATDGAVIRNVTAVAVGQGLYFDQAGGATIDGNEINGTYAGICVYEAAGFNITGNTIADSSIGISFGALGGSRIYHNNFINLTQYVSHGTGMGNVWDDGYPSGGNYWDNYTGTDSKSGPGQNVPGSDGIGDTPFVVDSDITDHYPLMAAYEGEPPGPEPLEYHLLTLAAGMGGTTGPMPGVYNLTVAEAVVYAIADPGWEFDHWVIDGSVNATNNPLRIWMDTDRSALAVFYHPPYVGDTIYIRTDGSVYPAEAPLYRDGNLYTVCANMTVGSNGIVVERDDAIIDGGGYFLTGTGGLPRLAGIGFSGIDEAIVTGLNIQGFARGVVIEDSYGIWVLESNITRCTEYGAYILRASSCKLALNRIDGTGYRGIYLEGSDGNEVSGNSVAGDGEEAIWLYLSGSNTVYSNAIEGGTYGLRVNIGNGNILQRNNITAPMIAGINIDDLSQDNQVLINRIMECMVGISSSGYGTVVSRNSVEGQAISPHEGIVVTGERCTVERNNVTSFSIGILYGSSGGSISWNRIEGALTFGIKVAGSDSVQITGNRVNGSYFGLSIEGASGPLTLRDNLLWENDFGFGVSGNSMASYAHDIDSSNKVDDKPICYWVDMHNLTVPDGIGYLGLIGCSNITVRGIRLGGNGQGILLVGTSNSSIAENVIASNIDGVLLALSSRGNKIIGNDIQGNRAGGIRISGASDRNLVQGNSISGNTRGVVVEDSELSSIVENRVTGSTVAGIVLEGSDWNQVSGNAVTGGADGLALCGASYNTISQNEISLNTQSGISIATRFGAGMTLGSYQNAISGNSISSNGGSGIKLEMDVHHLSNSTRIAGNNIRGNGVDGISLTSTVEMTLVGNVIEGNGRDGIRIEDWVWQIYEPTTDRILGNIIAANNGTGINVGMFDVLRMVEVVIADNRIADNHLGVRLYTTFFGSIYHNSILENGVVPGNGSFTAWDDGYPSGGNYWSDYSGTDGDGDGIGDTPHVIDARNADRYPLMSPREKEATVAGGGGSALATLFSNGAISHLDVGLTSLDFTVSGPSGGSGYVLAIFPAVNITPLTVTVDHAPLPEPFPFITSNGTHYFIYFELTFSSHEVSIQYADRHDDVEPPATGITIGEPRCVGTSGMVYVISATPFALSAEDNTGGTGVASTFYCITNSTHSTGWREYSGPFSVAGFSDGEYKIGYYSRDNAGNTEPAREARVTLFSWDYSYEDTMGRGTALKVNVDHNLFQFTAPGQDYGIRKATYMKQVGRAMIILHSDGTLRLNTVMVDTKLDFCHATAWDIKTRMHYLLIDKPGLEG